MQPTNHYHNNLKTKTQNIQEGKKKERELREQQGGGVTINCLFRPPGVDAGKLPGREDDDRGHDRAANRGAVDQVVLTSPKGRLHL